MADDIEGQSEKDVAAAILFARESELPNPECLYEDVSI